MNSQQTKLNFNQRSYQLLPYEILAKRAIKKQLDEAARLYHIYGNTDPEIHLRYLHVATGCPIKGFQLPWEAIWNENELIQSLPKNWEKKFKLKVSEKQQIALSGAFKILFPEKENAEEDEEIYRADKLEILVLLRQKFLDWGWFPTDNPRIFLNPLYNTAYIDNLVNKLHEIKLHEFIIYTLKMKCETVIIQRIGAILEQLGWERKKKYIGGKTEYVFRKRNQETKIQLKQLCLQEAN